MGEIDELLEKSISQVYMENLETYGEDPTVQVMEICPAALFRDTIEEVRLTILLHQPF